MNRIDDSLLVAPVATSIFYCTRSLIDEFLDTLYSADIPQWCGNDNVVLLLGGSEIEH